MTVKLIRIITLVAVASLGLGCASSQVKNTPRTDPLREASSADLLERGKALLAQGDYIRAEQYLTGAVKLGKKRQDVLPLLLEACVRSGRYHAALGHANESLTHNPEDWRLRFMVATLYYSLGDTVRAQEELARVLREESSYAPAHYVLGEVLVAVGDAASSKASFERYLELAPKGARAAEARARLAKRPKRARQARSFKRVARSRR